MMSEDYFDNRVWQGRFDNNGHDEQVFVLIWLPTAYYALSLLLVWTLVQLRPPPNLVIMPVD